MGIPIAVWVWVLLFVLFVIVELATLGLTTIWFMPGALISLVIAALGGNVFWQIAIFTILSAILFVFTRPVAVKAINAKRVKTNIESIIGLEGVVLEKIDNMAGTGVVFVNGLEWTARSPINEINIDKDSKVIVKAVEGVKLIVAKQN